MLPWLQIREWNEEAVLGPHLKAVYPYNMMGANVLFLLLAFRCFFTDWAKTTAAAGQEGCVCHPTHKLFWEAGESVHGKSRTRPQRDSANTTTRAKTITLYISPHPPAKHPSARDPCYCGAWCWHAICVTASDSILIQGALLFKEALMLDCFKGVTLFDLNYFSTSTSWKTVCAGEQSISLYITLNGK